MLNVLLGEAVDVTGAFTTAITSVQNDVMGMIVTALPIGLAIAGLVLGIRIGWKFFKSVAK